MTKVPFIKKIYLRAEIDQGILNQKLLVLPGLLALSKDFF
jgi:hypothetical protein